MIFEYINVKCNYKKLNKQKETKEKNKFNKIIIEKLTAAYTKVYFKKKLIKAILTNKIMFVNITSFKYMSKCHTVLGQIPCNKTVPCNYTKIILKLETLIVYQ